MEILLENITPVDFESSYTTSIVAYDSEMTENEGMKLLKSTSFPTTEEVSTLTTRVDDLELIIPELRNDIATINDRIDDLEANEDYCVYGDLSVTGSSVSVIIQNISFLIRRLNTTELEVRATTTNSAVLNITHRFSGNNTEETLRETFDVGPTGTVIATVTVGTYVLGELFLRIGNSRYNIIAGSDDDALTQAWVEVKPIQIR